MIHVVARTNFMSQTAKVHASSYRSEQPHFVPLCLSVSFVLLASTTEKIALWNVSTKRCRMFDMPFAWRSFGEGELCLTYTRHMPISYNRGTLTGT